jgi:hypothetical protein
MLMTTLRTAEEVRDVAQMPDVPLPKPDPQMLAIAEKIVDQQAGEFDPSEFVDRYEGALRELIEEKKKGHAPRARPAINDDTNVVDLMAALRNSLKGSGKDGAAPAGPLAACSHRAIAGTRSLESDYRLLTRHAVLPYICLFCEPLNDPDGRNFPIIESMEGIEGAREHSCPAR